MRWTDYIREIKRQWRDVYGFVPTGGTDDDPTFASIPDGEYPMEIDGKRVRVHVRADQLLQLRGGTMRKRDQLTKGCMAKARDDELTFVLLGRDRAAPTAIRAWIAERVRIGKNRPDDPQILEAEECARMMEAES
jgi:hypothetical protein